MQDTINLVAHVVEHIRLQVVAEVLGLVQVNMKTIIKSVVHVVESILLAVTLEDFGIWVINLTITKIAMFVAKKYIHMRLMILNVKLRLLQKIRISTKHIAKHALMVEIKEKKYSWEWKITQLLEGRLHHILVYHVNMYLLMLNKGIIIMIFQMVVEH